MSRLLSRIRTDNARSSSAHDELEDSTAASHSSNSPLLSHSSRRRRDSPADLALDDMISEEAVSRQSTDETFETGPQLDEPLGIALDPDSVRHTPAASRDVLDDHDSSDVPHLTASDALLDDADDPIDNSPYPQVRASVSARDDLSLSINTPRMWFLSMMFTVFGSGTNLFFSLRYPSVTIAPIIALLLVHPLGLLWDRMLKRDSDPPEIFSNGSLESEVSRSRLGTPLASPLLAHKGLVDRMRLYLAQGQWNAKEHACVYIASNVSFGFAFATDVIVEQEMFYKQAAPILYQILLVISTQVLGYAVAGLTRRYLVRPSAMIWPSTLIASAMFTTLHKEENKPAGRWRMSRWRFFLFVFLGSVAFYFLPGFLMPALSYFNVMTWFAPSNVVVANLFGVSSGLGLFPLTFDWSQIAFTGSPLIVPFWAALNVVGGLVVVMWIIAPILYYTNFIYSAYMPILSSSIFDKFGKVYDVSKVLRNDFTFDEGAYHNYSRVFLPITYVLSYGVQFAALTALVSHTACWHGRDIWRQWRRSLVGEASYEPIPNEVGHGSTELPRRFKNRGSGSSGRSSRSRMSEPAIDEMMGAEDVHNRLMERYEDVPVAWYIATGIVMLAIGMFVVEFYPVHLPWYGLLLAITICAVLFIPIGIVMAITNQQSSIYLVCQLLAGVLFPGRPVANMIFTTYGYITSTQGLKFTSDLKLGHYMHIPPRVLFGVQMASTILASLTQITVLNILLVTVPGICTPQAAAGFTCPLARVHFNGSILWGVLGPARFFGPSALYGSLVWAFPLGLVAPLIVYAVARRRGPGSKWRKVNLPVLFGSLSWIPPATGLNFSVWALVCYAFNHVIKRKHGAWWRKYNMTLSAALDAGVAAGVLIVFFGIVQTGLGKNFKWWGTEVYKQGCDWRACSFFKLAPGKSFGPETIEVPVP